MLRDEFSWFLTQECSPPEGNFLLAKPPLPKEKHPRRKYMIVQGAATFLRLLGNLGCISKRSMSRILRRMLLLEKSGHCALN
jgi:hypothetical protein